MKRWCLLGLLIVSLGARAAPVLLNESFDNLATSGWTIQNVSSPVGTTSWFQGNAGVFNAHSGPPNSYAAANLTSTNPLGGVISTWLISPEIQFASQILSFFTRTEGDSTNLFGDGLRVLVSVNGASTALGDFTELFNINAANVGGAYPEDWTQFIGFLGATGTGRIAFEYTVGANAFANYIGIDTVSIGIPEPGTLLLLGIAALAAGVARRAGVVLLAVVAGSAIAQTPAPVQPAGPNGAMSFPNVRVIQAGPGGSRMDTAPSARGGFRAYIDPATGALAEPDREQVAALEAAMPAEHRKPPRKALSFFSLPRGGVGVRLDDQYMVYSVARRENGRIVEACVPGEDLAERLVRMGSEPTKGSQQ